MRNLLRVIHIGLWLISCREPEQRPDSVFRFNMETALNSLDPAFARDQFQIWATSQFYNGLVQLDSAMNIVPAIAYRWDLEQDGKLWRFFLRKDVRFHDNPCFPNGSGRVVTAQDFVYSFKRIIDPQTASPGAWIFNDKLADEEAFRALSDTVLEIRLNRAFPPFAGMLSMPYCFVVPREAVEYYGTEFRANPVGTGPFILHYWEEGIKLIGERNPNYHEQEYGIQLPYLDGFEITFIESKQTAFLEFIQGKLDFFNGLEGSYKDELLTRDGRLKPKYTGRFQLHTGPYLNTEYIGFMVDPSIQNPEGNPFLDKNLRKALSFAVNREEMMRYLRNNIGTPGNGGFIPSGLPGHAVSGGPAYNKDSALYYLKLSSYDPAVELPIYTTKNYLDLTVYIQRMWEEIGVRSRIEVNPGPFHRERVSKSQFTCFRGSWLADYPDAENYLALFYSPNFSPSGPNYTHFKNAYSDSLYQNAMNCNDPVKRAELYRQIDSLVMEECPAIVLFYDQTLHLLSNKVSRMPVNALNQLSIKHIRFYENP